MDCVNHTGTNATAFCQNCGKALCASCVRNAGGGQILCEPCWTSWQTLQQPFVPANAGGPNPSAAAVLGLIPGVGAMYNGQFFKGLIHVVIFAVLVSHFSTSSAPTTIPFSTFKKMFAIQLASLHVSSHCHTGLFAISPLAAR